MPRFMKKKGGKASVATAIAAGPMYAGPVTKAPTPPPATFPVRSTKAMKKKMKGGE